MARKNKTSAAKMAAAGRVSPTAPDFASPSFQAWDEALSDPATKAELDRGLADAAAGRTKPWQEIRTRARSS